ncbi:MAG: hypothetical protein KIT74_02840 [Fimbriimonadales bacterium]|nr:hypothetical protein [Fimbriimonadales bacterium]
MIRIKTLLAGLLAAGFILVAIGCDSNPEPPEVDPNAPKKEIAPGERGEGTPGTAAQFETPQVD